MSHSSNSGKEYIEQYLMDLPNDLKTKPVLDIGCGAGKLHALYSDRILSGFWTGIEIFEPFIEKWKLAERYGMIANMNVLDWIKDNGNKRYGVVFCGDVLEHMTKEDAKIVLKYARSVADVVIVSIPIGYYPQGEFEGNPYEVHVTDNWTDEDFIETFGEPTKTIIDQEIGVYIYDKLPKRKLKIAVYAISKNESKFVETFAKSAKDADYIVVADTGSTDNTVKLCKENGIDVHSISIKPWRFDYARNASLALVPSDADICICLDLDEQLVPGWRKCIEKAWLPSTTRMRYKFDWSKGVVFHSDKIHSRTHCTWKHPCHELLYKNDMEESWVQTDTLLITHHPDDTKSRSSYLPLLEMGYRETPEHDRTVFYLAREYAFREQWAKAKELVEKYLNMPHVTYLAERSYGMRILAQVCGRLNDASGELYWLLRAAAEYPQAKENWVLLAQAYYQRQDWANCYAHAVSACAVTNRQFLYFDDPGIWNGNACYDLAAISAFNLGLPSCVEYGQKALDMNPGDPRLITNLTYYKDKYGNS